MPVKRTFLWAVVLFLVYFLIFHPATVGTAMGPVFHQIRSFGSALAGFLSSF